MEKEYFVLRRANCGTLNLETGKMDTDIIGITDDEAFAKTMQSVFCYYEKVKFLERDLSKIIGIIADNYHDRLVMASMSGTNNNCQCCGKPTPTTTCIEHDSQDFTKDLWVCSDCYCAIVKYWQERKPKKIAPV